MSDPSERWTAARAEAHSEVAGRSTRLLCMMLDLSDSTAAWAGDARIVATVKGWVLDELRARYPDTFTAWMLSGKVPALEAFEDALALEERGSHDG